jgi:hypothetical protein
MDLLRQKKHAVRGFLDDQFLIAMPGMKDDRFARAVIYICAHSEEGAMGLIINQAQQMQFPDLLVQLGSMDEQEQAAYRERLKRRREVARETGLPVQVADQAKPQWVQQRVTGPLRDGGFLTMPPPDAMVTHRSKGVTATGGYTAQ